METVFIVKAIHIIGVIAWISALSVVGALVGVASASEDAKQRAGIGALARKIYLGFDMPAMAMAIAGGVSMIMMYAPGEFKVQGWLHTKITLVIGLFVLDHMLMRRLKQATRAGEGAPAPKSPRFILGLVGLFAVAIISLAVLKPGVGG